MEKVVLNIPDQASIDDFEIKMMVAGALFEKGKLTSGQAAEIVGISKREFIEQVGKFGFTIFGYTFEEVKADLENYEKWKKS